MRLSFPSHMVIPAALLVGIVASVAPVVGQQPPPAGAGELLTLNGCVQRARGNPQVGIVSPSGYMLMGASTQSYQSSSSGDAPSNATPPGTPGVSGTSSGGGVTSDSAARQGPSPREGLNLVLDGRDIARYAGKYVAVRGRLAPLKPEGRGSQRSPGTQPQRLIVESMTPLRSCDAR